MNGEAARDQGIERVLVNNEQAVALIMDYFREKWAPAKGAGYEFLFEEFRHDAQAAGMPEPHKNAWGAISTLFAKQKLAFNTGRIRQRKDKKAHKCDGFVWQVL